MPNTIMMMILLNTMNTTTKNNERQIKSEPRSYSKVKLRKKK